MADLDQRGQRKEEYVHRMFSAIAGRYDLINTVMSLSRDKLWRRFAVDQMALGPGDRALDVACGTAMLSREVARAVGPGGQVVGVDFCAPMLEVGRQNLDRWGLATQVSLVEGDAMQLPFADSEFAGAVSGFALRNVPDIPQVLAEMARVVRPGGRVVTLEFARPRLPVFRELYYLYFNCLVPLVGRLVSGTSGPYRYLPQSLKGFPHQREIAKIFSSVGLQDVRYFELMGGTVAVHVGTVA
ncbi:MAG TPA: bifunctional demethylmenaquinone methyltransferase/2-methoxy-6-polyprenyl-1,4-benzoquinol methylase UbiE [Spirochaetia bacterium]|nr:bifunctional demethylmenaquinone methyltransferase/2-methoxy-6-polyprenyl-1,4-benzoquinol methylase UbiE [Spirochaetia bacterium]